MSLPARASVVAALAAVMGAACSGTEVPLDPVTPASPALELNVRLSRATFMQGDTTRIIVTLRNVSSRSVRVNFTTSCTLEYAIRTTSGALVVPGGGSWACEPILSRIDLDRLEAIQRTFIWTGEGVPPGSYVVYGALDADMAVVSAGVPVTVTAAASPP